MIYIQDNKMYVKYYQNVLLIDDNVIEIEMKNNYIQIHGTELEVRYYSNDEIIIRGHFKSIEFK